MSDFERLLRGSACTTAAVNTNPTRTLSEILANMERAIEALAKLEPAGPLQVRESPYATQTVPARVHKKRRNQRDAYHQRVQKKWVKRWGTKQVPGAYVVDASAIGGSGKILIMHPILGRAAFKSLGPCPEVFFSPRDAWGSGLRS